MSATVPVLGEVLQERANQTARWGEQNHPDGTGGSEFRERAGAMRVLCEVAAAEGVLTWADIFEEEVAEALAEYDDDRLREELVQVAAVAVAWVEAIDRRRAPTTSVCSDGMHDLCTARVRANPSEDWHEASYTRCACSCHERRA